MEVTWEGSLGGKGDVCNTICNTLNNKEKKREKVTQLYEMGEKIQVRGVYLYLT